MRSTLTVALVLLAAVPGRAELRDSLTEKSPEMQSAGPLAFGPEGILFVSDPKGAAVFAIDTNDLKGEPKAIDVEGVDAKVAALLGTTADGILVNDVAVNPASGAAYLSISRGRGPDALPVVVRVTSSGKPEVVSLENVAYAKAELPNAPEDKVTGQGRRRRNQRTESITDLTYHDGQLVVAGLSNEEFASNLRAIPFPFRKVDGGTAVEIFHGAHGRYETRSPVRTFAMFRIDGEPHIMAAYTCTPLVTIPLADLAGAERVRGRTVAELGNRNRPLDMIVYQKDGKDYLLMANSARGVMKVSTDGLADREAITERVGGGKAGQTYETIETLQGVVQLDKLGERQALLLVKTEAGHDLRTVDLP